VQKSKVQNLTITFFAKMYIRYCAKSWSFFRFFGEQVSLFIYLWLIFLAPVELEGRYFGNLVTVAYPAQSTDWQYRKNMNMNQDF
jgi:hypothetical protein